MAKSSSKFAVGVVVGILVVVAFCGCCIGGAVLLPFLPFGILGHGGAAGAARSFLGQDPQVRREIGEIKSYGLFPSGSVSINSGHGRAHLIFRLEGSRAKGKAVVDLTKAPGKDWEVRSAILIAGGRRIILKGSPPAPLPGIPPPPSNGEEQSARTTLPSTWARLFVQA